MPKPAPTPPLPDGPFDWPMPVWCPLPRARMRVRQQGTRPYWHGVVYDRALGRSVMVHLGRREALTPALLDRKANELAAKLRDWVPPIPRWMVCPRCGR
jgi:hypothetical protein